MVADSREREAIATNLRRLKPVIREPRCVTAYRSFPLEAAHHEGDRKQPGRTFAKACIHSPEITPSAALFSLLALEPRGFRFGSAAAATEFAYLSPRGDREAACLFPIFRPPSWNISSVYGPSVYIHLGRSHIAGETSASSLTLVRRLLR